MRLFFPTSSSTFHCVDHPIAHALTQLSAFMVVVVCMSFPALAGPNRPPNLPLSGSALEAKMLALDTDFFDAYNQCDLKRFGDYMVPNVEFLHDQGGLMLSRAQVVAATKKYICGKVRRELVPGSLRVYAMKNYGAIAMGEHRFCELATQQCVGSAKFTHVWREGKGKWQMTRILSYDHQPLKP